MTRGARMSPEDLKSLLVGREEREIVLALEELLGVRLEVKRCSLPEEIPGFLMAVGGRARIFISEGLEPLDQRFVLAHELFHLVFHPAGVHFWDEMSLFPRGSFEEEADSFALSVVSEEICLGMWD